MILPTIHLNGTHRKDLYENYTVALGAVRHAIDRLIEARPNGRDYNGDAQFYAAQDEHQARINKLIEVRKNLEQLLAHVVDAPGPHPL